MTSRWGVWLVGRYTMFLLLAAVIVRCCDWSKYHNSYILTPIMNIVIAGTVYKTDLTRGANRMHYLRHARYALHAPQAPYVPYGAICTVCPAKYLTQTPPLPLLYLVISFHC